MVEGHRALDWLVRRRDGESIALIAHRAGVSPATVFHATRGFGPFPRAHQHLGRIVLAHGEAAERASRWVEQRKRGMLVAEIARAEGVSHQYVSRSTAESGPYPAPEVVAAWVAARRDGRPLLAVAEEAGVSGRQVRASTTPYGPYPLPGTRLPEGVLGVHGIAVRAGVSDPTVLRWRDLGVLPGPDFVTGRGRQLWLDGTVTCWLRTSERLQTCPECGARCLSVSRHRTAHRGRVEP